MNLRLFAHIQARASATEERRGGAKRRRQLLAGLSGRVVEVGAGSGVSFAHYPATVRELVAVEPERTCASARSRRLSELRSPYRWSTASPSGCRFPMRRWTPWCWPACCAACPTPAARWTRPPGSCDPGRTSFLRACRRRQPSPGAAAAPVRRDVLAASLRRLPHEPRHRGDTRRLRVHARDARALFVSPDPPRNARRPPHPRARASRGGSARHLGEDRGAVRELA